MVQQMGKKSGSAKQEKELSRDTANGFSHTCRRLISLSRHLLMNKNFEYVLLGKFTSDHIEKEFGKLRQGRVEARISSLFSKFLKKSTYQKPDLYYRWTKILIYSKQTMLVNSVINVVIG